MNSFLPTPRVLAALLLACAGCDSSDYAVTTYRAPKETLRPSAPKAATDGAAAAGLHWTAPTGWEEQPASGFRKGSFVVRGGDGKTADVSVISFPEEAGGVIANVNRWREQLKLTPLAEGTTPGTSFTVAGHEMFFVDLASEQPIGPDNAKVRVLGGIYPLHGETWFFKMMGPDPLVAAQGEAFQQFLRSVHIAGPGHSHAPAGADANANAGGGESTNAPTPPLLEATGDPPLQYTLPPGWEAKPLAPMRAASFKAIASNGKELDVSVVTLAGAAGGNLANVNRWREQVKLPPIDEATLEQSAEHVRVDHLDFLLFDLASAEPIGEGSEKQRILAAILDHHGRSWFIKMTGQDEAVASQKNAFADFLRGLKLH